MPAASDPIQGHPVLVWIHGGSFMYGSASDTKAENLRELVLTNRLVVVTIEYRLGVLGFLGSRRLQQPGAAAARSTTGNWGILDQQQALRWVSRHIRHFGGDTSRIGIAGWSAGAASVSLHLSAPGSAGLFSRAAMFSGGFTSWAAQSLEAAEGGYDAVLRKVGCSESPECHAEGPPCRCLLELDAGALVAVNPSVFWAPVVDGSVVALHPAEASRQGKVHAGVPILIGSALEDSFVDIGAGATGAEFRAYLRTVLSEGDISKAHELYMTKSFEQALNQSANAASHRGWSAAYWAARRVYADMVLTCPARRAARSWQSHTSAPAYWYLWDVAVPEVEEQKPLGGGGGGATLQVGACWPCPGIGHGSDQAYLFQLPHGSGMRGRAEWLAATYPALLADFVRGADPNVWNGFALSQGFARAWPTAENGDGLWFQANMSQAAPHLRSEVCDFWDSRAV